MDTKSPPVYTKKELKRFSELLLEATQIVEEMQDHRIHFKNIPDEMVGRLIEKVIMLKLRIVAVKYRD